MADIQVFNSNEIQSLISIIRDEPVMIDRDIAGLYGVTTKVLNQAVKRNINRFPDSFRFQLSNTEKDELVTNCDRFKTLKHSTATPYAFTEQGVAMLSAVLRSKTAVNVSIQIINAFVSMRKFIGTNAQLFQRLDRVELKQLEQDEKFNIVFDAIEKNQITPKQGIIFEGQYFDAHLLISKIIKSAKTSVLIIDNYIDETVLELLSKKQKKVSITIKSKTNPQKLDIEKFTKQYGKIKFITNTNIHDRFIIIDEKDVYHSGASLKDLGKKISALSKFDISALALLGKTK